MKVFIFCTLWGVTLATLRTVDVSPIVDIDLTLYKITYDKERGQILRDFPEKDGFSATKVELRGMETAERNGQAFIAVDGPIYRMAYCLHIPKLEFVFGKLDLPGMGSFSNVKVSTTNNKMDRFLEYAPLKNGKCLISDGIVWSDIGNGQLQESGQHPKDVAVFFNSTFRETLNARSGSVNLEYEGKRCKEFTTPFTTVFV